MSDLEIILNMLAESTTTEISKQQQPMTLEESRKVARRGGSVAGRARVDIETETGASVITAKSTVDFTQLIESIGDKESKDDKE